MANRNHVAFALNLLESIERHQNMSRATSYSNKVKQSKVIEVLVEICTGIIS